MIDEFELQSLSAAKWERHRNEFVNKIASVSEEICDDETSNDSKSQSSISTDAAVLLAYAITGITLIIVELRRTVIPK